MILYYVSKKGNTFDLTLTDHALKQFIKRYENAEHKKLNTEQAEKIIEKIFKFAIPEKHNKKVEKRKEKYYNRGENTVYLINSGFRFVVELNKKIIKTIECYGKLRSCNIEEKLFKEVLSNNFFENNLKELKKELRENARKSIS